jgi:predicted RNA-binding protein Jag
VAADAEKTAGEAAREKVEKREQVEDAIEQAESATDAERERLQDEDPRSAEERRIDAEPGTVEPGNLTETGPEEGKSTEELRREVEEAREELADTVTELGQKVDPRPKVEAAQAQAKNAAQTYGPPAAGVAVLLLIILVWLKRR